MGANTKNGKMQMTIGVDRRKLKPEPRINSALRAIKKFLLGTPSGKKKENIDNLKIGSPTRYAYIRNSSNVKATKKSTSAKKTSQDKFQLANYKAQQDTTKNNDSAAKKNQGFYKTGNNEYSVDDVQVVAKRPAAKNNSTTSTTNTKRTSRPRRNTYKTKAYREETESPVATDNIQPMTERERVANSLQFTPDYSSYAMRDPYGRSAAEAFDDEYAEKVARLRAASQQMMLDTPTVADLDRYYGVY